MGEAASKFAPGRDAFGLNEFFLLSGQGVGHVVEGTRELADFVVTLHIDMCVPTAGGDITRAIGEFFDRTSDALGNPPRQKQSNGNGRESDKRGNFEDLALQDNPVPCRNCRREVRQAIRHCGQAEEWRGMSPRWQDRWSTESS